MLSDSVAKFVSNEYDFETRQASAAAPRGFNDAIWQNFCDLGWTALPFSEAEGGLDGGPIETMLLMQHFGRGLVVEPYLANIVLAGGVLRRLASDTQKSRWLAPIIAGELQAALAFAEPQSRYDIGDIGTTATRDADGWLINGSKAVVLNGGNAELLIIPAVLDGVSLFAVAADTDGVTRRRYSTVDGATAAEITLRNVRVDSGALLGTAGDGLATLEAVLDEAILAVCAEGVGIMQALTEKTVEYSKNRVQFGVPIGSFQALQHRMVDMFTATEQSYSLLLWATMASAAAADDAKRAVSAIKYQIGTAGKRVGQEAVQLHGGMGMSWEFDVGHYFKRLTVIGQLFGNADWHLDRLAQ
ncbi:MAG: acyl-CoA dehydrogenase family protein [Gammaproteobacteria bacterium]|nr:acyl-CoA dehydrogenase family protein [Gammaproteobacteria bacterium]